MASRHDQRRSVQTSPTTLLKETEASLNRRKKTEEERRKRATPAREEKRISTRRESSDLPSPTPAQRDTEASRARKQQIEMEIRMRSNPARRARESPSYPIRDWENLRTGLRNNIHQKKSPFDIPPRNSSRHHTNQSGIGGAALATSTSDAATQTPEEVGQYLQSEISDTTPLHNKSQRHAGRKPRKLEIRNLGNASKETHHHNNLEYQHGQHPSTETGSSSDTESRKEKSASTTFVSMEHGTQIGMNSGDAAISKQLISQTDNELQDSSPNNSSGIGKWIDTVGGKLATFVKGSNNFNRDQYEYVHASHYIVLQNQALYLQNQCEEQRTELAELNYQNRRQESEIQEFQKKSLKLIGKSTWTPLNDEVVVNILEEIHNNIDDWADNWCLDHFNRFEELDNEEQEALMNFLCAVTQHTEVKDLQTMIQLLERNMTEPKLIATSYITHLMYTKLMSNPFDSISILSATEASNNSDVGTLLSESFGHVYQSMLEMDVTQTNVWRVHLMRILFERPVSSDRFDGLICRRDGILEILQSNVEDALSTSLVLGPGRVFVPEDFSLNCESCVELASCFQRSMELYIQLQTQFVQLQWLNPLVHPLNHRLFDDNFMREHFIQRKKVSTGMPVDLIVCPAISFIGNEDGERYDKEMLLLKSTVWVNTMAIKEAVIDEKASQSEKLEDLENTDNTEKSKDEIYDELERMDTS